MEQEPEPIVLEVPQAVGVPAELLGDQVHGLAPCVVPTGREEGEYLGLPPLDGLGQPEDFGGACGVSQLVEGVEAATGLGRAFGVVGGTELLLDGPGPTDLVVGVTPTEGLCHSGELLVGQPFVAPGEQPADPVEGIIVATPVTEGLPLDPPTYVVDGGVGQLDGVEDVHGDRWSEAGRNGGP